MIDKIKCLVCGESKARDKYSRNNLSRRKLECLKCQNIRRSKEAVDHAKAREASYKENMRLQAMERKAKLDKEIESQLTSRTPEKMYKQSPEIKRKFDEIAYNKEIDAINSMYDL